MMLSIIICAHKISKGYLPELERSDTVIKFLLLLLVVNALVSKQVAEERCHNVHLICTADEDIEDVKVRVWDSPGLLIDDDDEDGTGNGQK